MKTSISVVLAILLVSLLGGCAGTARSSLPIDTGTALPGGTVTLRGAPVQLTGTPVKVGDPLPSAILIDAFTMNRVDPSSMLGKVLIVSMVPSLDTRVCEAQTHDLGEKGANLPADIVRITVSRDTPFAQKRFAEESKLSGIVYLSDYRDGSFGRELGLLQKESMLLARAVIVVDGKGIVRYIQVVPELTHLPDMDAAIRKAEDLLKGG